MILQTTLCLAAAAALIHLWLFVRVTRRRFAIKVIHGDGGDDLLFRRIRAHANFTENTPLFLILMGLVEMTGKGGTWLAIAGALFMLARVAHAFGMDNPGPNALRAAGMLVTLLLEIALAAVAVLIALGQI